MCKKYYGIKFFVSSLLQPQIQKVVVALGDYMDVKCYACIGGTSVSLGISKLKEGQHVIVGTPGRVYDMLNRGTLGKNSFFTNM